MAKSKIIITFDTVVSIGDIITIRNSQYPLVDLKETFLNNRKSNYETEISTNALIQAENYLIALNLDYNNTSLYNITRDNITLTIEATQSNVVFSVIENTTGATISINNETETPAITIDTVAYSQATTSPSDYVKLNVTTSRLATFVNGVANVNNPFSYDVLRGINTTLTVIDADTNTVSQIISTPKKLLAANTTINIVNSPSGASISIVVTDTTGLVLEYSLDNINWKSSGDFSGLAAGNFTAYIKDQLGAFITKNFIVADFETVGTGIGVSIPYSDLPSKSNSFRFAKVVDTSIAKNDENTLSCELPYIQTPRKEIQLFQSNDIITTQIKTNYETITTTVIDEDLNETTYPAVKKTDFIGLKDKRDAIKYDLGNGLTGVYFTSGNKYDFDTEAITDTYSLLGAVPEWAFAGGYIIIDTAWYLITDVIYDESKLSEVIVFENSYTGSDASIIIGSIYNLFNYNVYEIDIDLSTYLDKKIQVNITQTDTRFDSVTYLSEIIDVKEEQSNTVEIVYYNETNTDIMYSTGIQHKIRIPIQYIAGAVSDDTESDKTDTSAYLLNSQVYELDEFYFDNLTKELMRKVVQAVSHEIVTINGVGYVKNESVEASPLIGTNLYKLTARMIKTSNVYNSQLVSGTETLETGSIEVPALVNIDVNKFVKLN